MSGPKQIITAKDVRDRYSLQDLSDINSALDSSIKSAHYIFQGILGTAFEENTITDVFYLDTAVVPAYNKQFRLRLTQAFLKPGTLAINYGGTRRAATTPAPIEDFTVDETRGLLFFDEISESSTGYANQFLVVSYTAGFGTGDTAAVKPPEWLKEALLSWISASLVFSAYKEDPAKAQPIAESLKREATQMVERYKRETALQFLPINF